MRKKKKKLGELSSNEERILFQALRFENKLREVLAVLTNLKGQVKAQNIEGFKHLPTITNKITKETYIASIFCQDLIKEIDEFFQKNKNYIL